MDWGKLIWHAVISLLVIGLGLSLVLRWLAASGVPLARYGGQGVSASPEQGEQPSRRELAAVFACGLGLRIGVFLLTALALAVVQGGFDRALSIWEQWDGWHYVRLVELGYDGYLEDGQHLFLVFFPLYVWLTRLVRLAVGNTLLSGLLVSWLCFAGGCVYFYRLGCLEYGRGTARRALLFLSLFPYAFFFGGMMTESLFFLTTAAGLWHIRRHQWGAAGAWGILAALTRMHGVLLIGAAAAELVQSTRLFALRGRELKQGLRTVLGKVPVLLLPLLGTGGYLLLNWSVDGNPFAFTIHQQHWSQGFCWISQTLWYLTQNALHYANNAVRLELWIPSVLLFLVFFPLMWKARKGHRSMLTLYAFACLVLDYSLSWLLSAGRYLSCALPFFFFAACLTRGRPRLTAVIAAGMAVLFALALSVYLRGGQIM